MTNSYKLSAYLVVSDGFESGVDKAPSRLLYATRTGKSILIKEAVYENLKSGLFEILDDKQLALLMKVEVIVPAAEDEFQEILERNILGLEDSKNLNVTIQPTANCQLGCGYCGQQHSNNNMDVETSNKIIRRIIGNLHAGRAETLSVQWFGAEPLMAYSHILEMSQKLIQHCVASNIKYHAHMITNGLSFKPAVFLKLVEQRVTHYQITLDGLGETHDLMRIMKTGGKTFEIIFANIVSVANLPEFREKKCGIAVRVNVNRVSVKSIFKLIDRLAFHELGEKGVTIDFQPIVDWGGNNAAANSLTKEEFASAEIDWILYAREKGFKFNRVLPRRTIQPCMVVEKDGEVYDAFGNIYPCYEFPYTEKYADDKYRIGTIDTIELVRNEQAVTKNWYQDIKTDISPCKRCELFPVCGGGCPKQWYNGEIACPSYKANIKEKLVLDYIIKLEGAAAHGAPMEHVAV